MNLLLLTSLTMIAFAANSVLNRLGVASGTIDPLGFAVIRLWAGAVMLAGLILMRKTRGGIRIGRRQLAGAGALLLYLFGFSAAYLSLDAGIGALVLFAVVQITMFAGAVLAREHVPRLRWAGSALALGGLVLLLAPGAQQVSLIHVAAMSLAGIGWGLYSLIGRGEADALGATAMSFCLAAPVGLLVWPATDISQATAYGIGLAILSGAITSGLGYALWYRVLPQLGASRAAVAQLSVPVIAALGGIIFIGEPIGWRAVIAAALVLSGVGLAMRAR